MRITLSVATTLFCRYSGASKLSNKATLALHLFSKCSFTLSKLRFFELRAPKISSCYTTSRLLVTGFAHGLEIRRALYLHYSNNKNFFPPPIHICT